MKLPFSKMHGIGNDFMIVDNRESIFPINPKLIQQLADRHCGIGFDQLLLVENTRTAAQADFYYRIFNADGYEVNQCGNGARCIAKFIHRDISPQKDICLETNHGLMNATIHDDGNVTVNLGKAELNPRDIPFVAETFANTYELQLDNQLVEFSAIGLGNPHCVILVNDLDNAPVKTLGKKLESHSRFPERVNVGFMQIIDRNYIKLRVYERGVGETSACGSGAAAAVVAGRLRDLLNKQVKVELLGGELIVEWNDERHDVLQTGPASFVFDGVYL